MKHFVLTLFVLTNIACDFDIPDKFEMPTWYLDLKIPLVQTRYQMVDISDSTAGIFLTDDSLGFKIIQEGDFNQHRLVDSFICTDQMILKKIIGKILF